MRNERKAVEAAEEAPAAGTRKAAEPAARSSRGKERKTRKLKGTSEPVWYPKE